MVHGLFVMPVSMVRPVGMICGPYGSWPFCHACLYGLACWYDLWPVWFMAFLSCLLVWFGLPVGMICGPYSSWPFCHACSYGLACWYDLWPVWFMAFLSCLFVWFGLLV